MQGPDNWDDVLKKNKIEGTCNRENCQGTKFAVSQLLLLIYYWFSITGITA